MDIKTTIERINNLTIKEKLHILSILKNHNVDFTKNINGYFFNLANIDKNILGKICRCLDLIEKNRDLISEMDKRRTNLLNYYKNLINDTLKQNVQKRIDEYNDFIKLQNQNNWTDITLMFKKKKFYRYTKLYNRDKYNDEEFSNLIEKISKDYYKSINKYDKNSVYYRLLTNMKSFTNKNNMTYYESNDNYVDKTNEIEDNNENEDVDIENGDGDGDVDIDIDVDMDIEEQEYDINDDNEDDNTDEINSEEEGEDEDEKSDIEDNNSNQDCNEDNLEQLDENEINKNNLDDKTKQQLMFYKTLLNKRGYQFDDDKNCFLIVEEYI